MLNERRIDINTTFNEAIRLIENEICEDIDYEKVAKCMGLSVFHFQRLFSLLTGIPIAEYIRSRRMTLAGFDIQRTDRKIIDIALQYRYESHSSFSRAFQQFHGFTPSEVRDKGKEIKIFSPIYLNIEVQGTDIINLKVKKEDAFQLFGKADVVVPMEHKFALEFIKEYGETVVENGVHAQINEAAGFPTGEQHPFHLLHGIYFKDEKGQVHFMYGWEKIGETLDNTFTVVDVPQSTWAVFTYEGAHEEGLVKIWSYIYTNWIYSSEYEINDHIVIEKETWIDEEKNILRAEVWLPVKNDAKE